jgi:hypothetical protein
MVKTLRSGIHIYDYMISYNLKRRKIWFAIDHTNIDSINEVDFSLTNSQKIQTKSNIITRLLLSTIKNIISDKSSFYDYFQKNISQ